MASVSYHIANLLEKVRLLNRLHRIRHVGFTVAKLETESFRFVPEMWYFPALQSLVRPRVNLSFTGCDVMWNLITDLELFAKNWCDTPVNQCLRFCLVSAENLEN